MGAALLIGSKTFYFLKKFLCFLLVFEMFNDPYRLVAYFVRTGLKCLHFKENVGIVRLDSCYEDSKNLLFYLPLNVYLLSRLNLVHEETYTAIFLINGLCIVYCSLLQCLTLVYLGWGQKSEFFCLLVTTHRLQSGTVVGYRSTTTAYCRYIAAKGH